MASGKVRKIKVKAPNTGKEYQYTYSYPYATYLATTPLSAKERALVDIVYNRRKLASLENGKSLTKKDFIHDIFMESIRKEAGYDENQV